MARLILTFETLHKVLSAERALTSAAARKFKCRPTPTPPGLSDSICGMSLELLEHGRRDEAVAYLKDSEIYPSGIYEIE